MRKHGDARLWCAYCERYVHPETMERHGPELCTAPYRCCLICLGTTPQSIDYMVTDDVWQAAGLPLGPRQGWAHLSCLSRRLKNTRGRPIGLDDFKDEPKVRVNRELLWLIKHFLNRGLET